MGDPGSFADAGGVDDIARDFLLESVGGIRDEILGSGAGDVFDKGPFSKGLRGLPSNLQGRPIKQVAPIRYFRLLSRAEVNFPETCTEFRCDSPTVILAFAKLKANPGPSANNFLFALPTELIDPTSGGIPPSIITPAHVSFNGCALYLPAGKWYLYYSDKPVNQTLHCLAFDCSDRMLAAHLLNVSGDHSTSWHPNEIAVSGTLATQLFSARVNRKAAFIQCSSPSVGFRLGVGFDPTISRGISMPPNQYPPLVLAGANLSPKIIKGFADDVAGSLCTMIEFV